MSGYDKLVAPLQRNEIEAKACAWRNHFGSSSAWVVDLLQIVEVQLPQLLPGFALRILSRAAMPDEEGRTHHSVPAIDLREDVYERLCAGDGRARFTTAHELGHFFFHSGESRPRAVTAIRARTIPRSQSSERQADDFAASFLMPEHVVRQFPNPTELSSGCKVSFSAADHRMRDLRLWPKGRPPVPEVEEFLRRMKSDKGRK